MIHDDLLTETDVSRWIHTSISLLRKWRRAGGGPKFLRIGRLIRYSPTDIQVWLDARSR